MHDPGAVGRIGRGLAPIAVGPDAHRGGRGLTERGCSSRGCSANLREVELLDWDGVAGPDGRGRGRGRGATGRDDFGAGAAGGSKGKLRGWW